MSNKRSISRVQLYTHGSVVWTYILHTGEVGKLSLIEDGMFYLRECTHPGLESEIIRAWLSPLELDLFNTRDEPEGPFRYLAPSDQVKTVSVASVPRIQDMYTLWEHKYAKENQVCSAVPARPYVDFDFGCDIGFGQLCVGSIIHNEAMSKDWVFQILSKGILAYPEASTFTVEQQYSDELTNEQLTTDKYYHRLFDNVDVDKLKLYPQHYIGYHIPHLNEIRYVDAQESPSGVLKTQTLVVLNASAFVASMAEAGMPPLEWDAVENTTMFASYISQKQLYELKNRSSALSEAIERIEQYSYHLSPL